MSLLIFLVTNASKGKAQGSLQRVSKPTQDGLHIVGKSGRVGSICIHIYMLSRQNTEQVRNKISNDRPIDLGRKPSVS